MKTVGDKLEAFTVTGRQAGFNQHEENGVSAFETITEESFPEMEDHLLLAEGLHLRLPDRDRRVRPLATQFADRDAVLLGGSTDNEFAKLAWRRDHKDLTSCHWSSPTTARWSTSLASAPRRRRGLRATFVVDPHNVIQHVTRTA